VSVEIDVTKIEPNRGRPRCVSVVIESENLDKSNCRSGGTLEQTQTPRTPFFTRLAKQEISGLPSRARFAGRTAESWCSDPDGASVGVQRSYRMTDAVAPAREQAAHASLRAGC
jgi:hypothetical protein